jgi:hypothetical protein
LRERTRPAAEETRVPEAPANPKRSLLLALLAAFAIVLVGGIALAIWSTHNPNRLAETATNSQPSPPSQESAADTSAISSPASQAPPATPTPSGPAAMTEADWNAHVAEQYPGYRIKERIVVADQWQKGLGGVNYVLVNAREPEFTLLVSLARVRPGDTLDDVPENYLDVRQGIATSDVLFSADAARLTPYLADDGQDAIVDAFVAKKPRADAVAFSGFGDDGSINFMVTTGPGAVGRAIESSFDADYAVEGDLPTGPRNERVAVRVSRL